MKRVAILILKFFLMLMGLSKYDFYLWSGMKHRYWLCPFRSKVKVPRIRFTFPHAAKITPEDIELSTRLISAYYKSTHGSNTPHDIAPKSMWDTIIKRYCEELILALERADAAALAIILSTMFRSMILCGIASCDLYKGLYKHRLGLRIWSLHLLDQIVSLGEYLAVIRTESPEQGIVGYAFTESIGELVSRINKAAGISIGFPEIGAPYGLMCDGSLITMESAEHIYVALRINETINRFLGGVPPRIVEIGAGFGGTAFRLLQIRTMKVKSYTLIDLPYVNVIQGYFLSKVFGAKNVALHGETDCEHSIIRILPTHAISLCSDVDLLINEDSMPEMPKKAVEDYVLWAKHNVRNGGIFYSYNQEAYSPVNNIPQVLVPEVVASVQGFDRVSRNDSWLHPGHVEEVYVIGKNRSQSDSSKESLISRI